MTIEPQILVRLKFSRSGEWPDSAIRDGYFKTDIFFEGQEAYYIGVILLDDFSSEIPKSDFVARMALMSPKLASRIVEPGAKFSLGAINHYATGEIMEIISPHSFD